MKERIAYILGAALFAAGYLLLRLSHKADQATAAALLMGFGAALLALGAYLDAKSLSELLRPMGLEDPELKAGLRWKRLRFWCVLAGVAALAGLVGSAGGVNPSTVGYSILALGALLTAVIGRGAIMGDGALSDSARLLAAAAAIFGVIVSGVTLIMHLSGASDAPERWNPYSQLGAAGLAASAAMLLYLAFSGRDEENDGSGKNSRLRRYLQRLISRISRSRPGTGRNRCALRPGTGGSRTR